MDACSTLHYTLHLAFLLLGSTMCELRFMSTEIQDKDARLGDLNGTALATECEEKALDFLGERWQSSVHWMLISETNAPRQRFSCALFESLSFCFHRTAPSSRQSILLALRFERIAFGPGNECGQKKDLLVEPPPQT